MSGRTIHDEFHHAGYDQEEEYFYRLNRERIARLHSASRAAESAGARPGGPAALSRRPFVAALARILAAVTRPRPCGIGQFPI